MKKLRHREVMPHAQGPRASRGRAGRRTSSVVPGPGLFTSALSCFLCNWVNSAYLLSTCYVLMPIFPCLLSPPLHSFTPSFLPSCSSIHTSTYPPIHLPIHPPIHLSVHPSIHPLSHPVFPRIYSFLYQSHDFYHIHIPAVTLPI